MALEITKTFVVKAAPQAVWDFLVDVERVAKCMPGAAITAKLDDKTYTGTMTVKVGPVTQSYKGKIVFEKLDEAARAAHIVATGQDVRGKGGADMRLSSTMKEIAADETEVTAVSQVNITGILAQMGRGMIQDVSDQLFGVFSQRMRAELEAGASVASAAPAAPAIAPPPANAVTDAAPATAAPVDAARQASTVATADAAAAVVTGAAAPPTATPDPNPTPAAAAPTARPAPSARAPEVLDLGPIGARAAKRATLRLLGTPGFWLAVVAIAVVLYFILR
jgi:carbon monoxide dehydrogenase subunit G